MHELGPCSVAFNDYLPLGRLDNYCRGNPFERKHLCPRTSRIIRLISVINVPVSRTPIQSSRFTSSESRYPSVVTMEACPRARLTARISCPVSAYLLTAKACRRSLNGIPSAYLCPPRVASLPGRKNCPQFDAPCGQRTGERRESPARSIAFRTLSGASPFCSLPLVRAAQRVPVIRTCGSARRGARSPPWQG